jgi:hypothetical protein
MGHNSAVVSVDLGNRGNVSLGNHQKMRGCLGGNVIKCEAQVVFIDLIAGDVAGNDLAEQTIRHEAILLRF